MGSRLKEDERNERNIRALLKQSENRRCINCGSLGPQYVCTTFSIFVCTNCSGLHREFSHRIKSVSMAKFTVEEVKSLQAGGNERARELFLKEYDLQRNPLPENGNLEKLRDFIKGVYVERRYTGDRAPPKGRQGDRDDAYESRQVVQSPRRDFQSNVRSPPFEDRHDDRQFAERRRSDFDRGRYDDRKSDDRMVRFEGKRNPGRYDLKSQSDNRRQEDKSRLDERGREQRASYDDLFANEIRHGRRSSADDRIHIKDFDGDSPPVRPVTEILGDNVPALWVEEFRHTNGRDDDDRSSLGSPADQRRDGRLTKHGSFGVVNGSANVSTSAVIKRVNSGSLIDFSAEPESSGATIPAADPFGVSIVGVSVSSTISSHKSTGWATFDTAPVATAVVPAEGPPAGYPDVFLAQSNNGQWSASGWTGNQISSAGDDWSSLVGSSVQQPATAAGSQSWSSFLPASKEPSSQVLPLETELLQQQPNPVSGRSLGHRQDSSRELPTDLFAQSFSTAIMPPGGLTIGQQIPGFSPAAPLFGPGSLPAYAQRPRSRNPFDLPGEVPPPTALGTFPSMGSLQSALPNGALSGPSSIVPTSSSNQWSIGSQPASFPSGGTAGASGNFFIHHDGTQFLQGQNTGARLGHSEPGSFNNRSSLAADQSLGGQGSSEFSAYQFVRSNSGNPFG